MYTTYANVASAHLCICISLYMQVIGLGIALERSIELMERFGLQIS